MDDERVTGPGRASKTAVISGGVPGWREFRLIGRSR